MRRILRAYSCFLVHGLCIEGRTGKGVSCRTFIQRSFLFVFSKVICLTLNLLKHSSVKKVSYLAIKPLKMSLKRVSLFTSSSDSK